MVSFELPDEEIPLGDILPSETPNKAIETAKHECEPFIKRLTSDISGVGQKAAERYLLRYEYGFTPTELASKEGVTPQTITNQTNGVRKKIRQHPTLAQVVGDLRANRVDLKRPITDRSTLYNEIEEFQSREVKIRVSFEPGSYATSYSWQYQVRAEVDVDDKTWILLVDYIVNANTGVFLKRSLKAIWNQSWRPRTRYLPKRQYTVYPLPHTEIHIDDGGLTQAVAQHLLYDISSAFLSDYASETWKTVEANVEDNTYDLTPSAKFSLSNVLFDRVNSYKTGDPIRDYSHETHIQDNIEQLLYLYPTTPISQLPHKTIKLLWHGPIESQLHQSDPDGIDAVLQSSEIRYRDRY